MSTNSKSQTVFKKAEALGEIKTHPVVQDQLPEVKEETEPVIDNPEDFRIALGNAQMDGKEFIEVSPKLYSYLLKNAKSPYITYGDPGIKVYKAGTREDIEREEAMSAEMRAEYLTKKRIEGRI